MQSYTGYNMGYKIELVDQLPADVEDFTEKPYRYEIWLQHNAGGNQVPAGTKGAVSISSTGVVSILTGLLALLLPVLLLSR